MAFSSLTLTRNNIDALEELTFKGINVTSGTTTLNLSEKDNLILAKAIKLLKQIFLIILESLSMILRIAQRQPC